MYIYHLKQVRRLVDGDTYELDIDVGFNLTKHITARLLGYDTPEIRADDADEVTAAANAVIAVQNWFEECPDELPIYVKTVKTDSFGRWLCNIYTPANSELGYERRNLGDALVKKDLAVTHNKWRDTYLPSEQDEDDSE